MALGGIVGPVGFVLAWIIAGSRARSYSPIDDAISRLAAVHSSTRLVMTLGFIAFGVGVPLFAIALRSVLPGPAWLAAIAAGVCTLAVAAFPLDAGLDSIHGASAVLGYICLAAIPLLAPGPLAREGRPAAARFSTIAGCTSAALLAASLFGPIHGLFQRAGLGVTDLWICAAAVALLRMRSEPATAGGRRSSDGHHDVGRGING